MVRWIDVNKLYDIDGC